MIDLNNFEQEGQKVLDFIRKDIQAIRTNRASADLVAHILVNAYGTKTPLEQLATITVPEPRLIVIQPWDRNIVKEIEIALTQANLGTIPTIKETVIQINLPPLNEETRKNLVKILHQKLEQTRINLRNLRDEFRSKINKLAKEKEITEDDKYRLLEDLDKKTSKFMEEIETIGERKEREITTL
ncbi:MAG: ribosome recycling factor [Patescibacteria group bacterium]